MNIKRVVAFLIVIILLIDLGVFLNVVFFGSKKNATSQSAVVKSIDSTIAAEGTVTAQNQATLHFQTGGKLVSVPFQEGDKISQGETIAQLDTYALQRQLSTALNSYKSTRDTFDQTQQNSQTNVLQNQQKVLLPGPEASDPNNVINDAAKRIVDQNQANLDTSVANVEVANYALQLATLTSPLTGVVMHEDVNVAGQNVTPVTSFIVADPDTKVFRANIPAGDIDYVEVGMHASVILDGIQNKIDGTIVKVYPSKATLSDGEQVYQVDIQSDEIKSQGKLDQTGTAIIMTNAQNVMLVPAWTVLSGRYVWVNNNGKPQLRSVTVGKTHGDQIEITKGLSRDDQVITDPKAIPAKEYPLL